MKKAYDQLVKLLNAIANWKGFWWTVFAGCAVPAVLLLLRCFVSPDFMAAIGLPWAHFSPGVSQFVQSLGIETLGVDPLKSLLHESGEDGLGVLLACLAITPIRRVFKVNGIQKTRRMVGVWAFAYAFLHVTIYLTFDQLCYSWSTCEFQSILKDIEKRPFIWMGLISFTCMTLLALTSTTGSVRLLKKKWQTLHRLVYLAGIAGVIHFIWIQKSDISEPLMWAGWLAVFFAIRIYFSIQKRRKASPGQIRTARA